MNIETKIIDKATHFYLNSRDFNGLPIRNLIEELDIQEKEVNCSIETLIKEDKISIVFGDLSPSNSNTVS
jgi:hypothetical protein